MTYGLKELAGMFWCLESSGEEEDSKHLSPEGVLLSLHFLNDLFLFPEGTTIRAGPSEGQTELYSMSACPCMSSVFWEMLALVWEGTCLDSNGLWVHFPYSLWLWLTFLCTLWCQQPVFCQVTACTMFWTHKTLIYFPLWYWALKLDSEF
jgi:hypothetical protein